MDLSTFYMLLMSIFVFLVQTYSFRFSIKYIQCTLDIFTSVSHKYLKTEYVEIELLKPS